MFESSRILVETYLFRLQPAGSKLALHQMQEVRARLRQLDYCYGQIRNLSRELMPEPTRRQGGKTTNQIHLFADTAPAEVNPARLGLLETQNYDPLIILVENFYYSSHRIIDILNDGIRFLPGLIRVRAYGVTTVRNHLIEHVRGKGGNTVYSFSLNVSGPRLRPLSWSKDEKGSRDEGLWKNADEFRASLNKSLEAGIAHFNDA